MKVWQQKLIENPTRYVLSWVTWDEWRHIVLNELFEHGSTPGRPSNFTFSDESRQRMSIVASNRKWNNETKQKMSTSHIGRVKSDDTKQKMSKKVKGERSNG